MVSLSPPPQLSLHGGGAGSPDLPPTLLPSSVVDQLAPSAEGGSSSSRRWSSEHAQTMRPKRARLHPCSSSPSPEEEKRSRQEEEDRRLALLLQKELDQEERRAVDRRKGSSDAYPLRPSSASTSRKTTSLPSTQKASAPKSSSPGTSSRSPSSPPLGGGRKQATLTHMFSSSRS